MRRTNQWPACLINGRERLTRDDRERFTVGQRFHGYVAALNHLRALTVQPVRDLFDSLQIATFCHFDQLSSDGAQVAKVTASADFHPLRVGERLLVCSMSRLAAHIPPPKRLKLQANP
jgi:hypothetical protein